MEAPLTATVTMNPPLLLNLPSVTFCSWFSVTPLSVTFPSPCKHRFPLSHARPESNDDQRRRRAAGAVKRDHSLALYHPIDGLSFCLLAQLYLHRLCLSVCRMVAGSLPCCLPFLSVSLHLSPSSHAIISNRSFLVTERWISKGFVSFSWRSVSNPRRPFRMWREGRLNYAVADVVGVTVTLTQPRHTAVAPPRVFFLVMNIYDFNYRHVVHKYTCKSSSSCFPGIFHGCSATNTKTKWMR